MNGEVAAENRCGQSGAGNQHRRGDPDGNLSQPHRAQAEQLAGEKIVGPYHGQHYLEDLELFSSITERAISNP